MPPLNGRNKGPSRDSATLFPPLIGQVEFVSSLEELEKLDIAQPRAILGQFVLNLAKLVDAILVTEKIVATPKGVKLGSRRAICLLDFLIDGLELGKHFHQDTFLGGRKLGRILAGNVVMYL